MTTPLRVLVVEDSEPDTLLMMRVLRNAEFEPKYERVETPDAMRAALESNRWDLIIADFSLPHFSGPDAFRILQESEKDIPFILVSGTVPEQVAIDMMRSGAQDFVLKNDLARLGPAVARELRASKIREALRRSESNFRAIFDYTPAAVFAYDRNGTILHANPACEELFGIPRDKLASRSMFQTVAKAKDQAEVMERVAYVFAGGSVENIEWRDTHPDGSSKWILTNVTPVLGPDGEVIMGLSLNVDITERKLAEERERELERHKLEFYRRTIQAATGGKLLICDRAEIESVAGPALASWQISESEQLEPVRHAIADLASAAGMDRSRIEVFILCVGEAITNAVKHAKQGTVSLHRVDEHLACVVEDNGPGIAAFNLPDVALSRGYSTVGTLGMGYKVMISMADKVYLATGPDGTTVAIEMAIEAQKRPEYEFRGMMGMA